MGKAKILHLNLYRKWFVQILKKKKKEEYRDKTNFWKRRLFNEDGSPREYEYIVFRNGYGKKGTSPEMKVEILGVREDKDRYSILLGKVFDEKNCDDFKV